jgi:hypothetical protein
VIRTTRDAIAANRIECGSPVRVTLDDQAFPSAVADADGIAHRDQRRGPIEAGETVRVVTGGDLLALVDGQTRWAIVTSSKVELQ